MNSIKLYTDGSYTTKNPTVSGWGFISEDKNVKRAGSLTGEIVSMRQIGGELKAVMEAVKYAINNDYDEVTICYDYIGIEKWARNQWKANKRWTQAYRNWIMSQSRKIKINFLKVSGSKNIADEAARQHTGAKRCH